MQKEYTDKVSFEEFVPSLVSYCLFSSYHLMMFVFDFIDKNKDEIISRDEIVKYLSIKREGNMLGIFNHPETIKFTSLIQRSDRINFEEFERLSKRFPFICYPAIVFQNKLRENYINSAFWNKLLHNVAQRHMDNRKDQEKKKIEGKIEEIQENIVREKVKTYKVKIDQEQAEKNKVKKIYQEEYRQGIVNDDIYYNKYKNNKIDKEEYEMVKSLDNIDIQNNLEGLY